MYLNTTHFGPELLCGAKLEISNTALITMTLTQCNDSTDKLVILGFCFLVPIHCWFWYSHTAVLMENCKMGMI